jgi:hypothetical protein
MLYYIDLNKASIRVIARNETTDKITHLIKRCIQTNSELLVGDFRIRNVASQLGRVFFTLYYRELPISMAYSCWDPEISREAWRYAENLFFNTTELDIQLDLGWSQMEVPPTPWHASVTLLRQLEQIPEKEAFASGLIESCVTLAFIDIDAEQTEQGAAANP